MFGEEAREFLTSDERYAGAGVGCGEAFSFEGAAPESWSARKSLAGAPWRKQEIPGRDPTWVLGMGEGVFEGHLELIRIVQNTSK